MSHVCRDTQDWRVVVKSSDQSWSTGWGNGKPLQDSCCKNPMNSRNRQKVMKQGHEPPQSQKVSNMLLGKSGGKSLIVPKRGMSGPKWKWCSVVDMSGGEREACCCKEQYCIVTWNVRSVNQGKLDMVTQEMARLNLNILGINELKWMGMGEFSSDDHYIYYQGQESLKRNWIALIVNKRVQNAVLGWNLKNDRRILVCFQGRHSTS